MYILSYLIRRELNFLFLLSTLLFVGIDISSYNYIVLGQEDRREKDDEDDEDDDDDRREKDDEDDEDDDDRREKDDEDDDRREKDDNVPFILPLPFP